MRVQVSDTVDDDPGLYPADDGPPERLDELSSGPVGLEDVSRQKHVAGGAFDFPQHRGIRFLSVVEDLDVVAGGQLESGDGVGDPCELRKLRGESTARRFTWRLRLARRDPSRQGLGSHTDAVDAKKEVQQRPRQRQGQGSADPSQRRTWITLVEESVPRGTEGAHGPQRDERPPQRIYHRSRILRPRQGDGRTRHEPRSEGQEPGRISRRARQARREEINNAVPTAR